MRSPLLLHYSLACRLWLHRGKQNRVDDVDHAIGLVHIGDGHSGRAAIGVSDLDPCRRRGWKVSSPPCTVAALYSPPIVVDHLHKVGPS